MNKLTQLFNNRPKNLLNIFFTAGFPELKDTTTILKSLEEAGADLVEIGIPFSDPLADGPTIQASSKKALENGMSIAVLLDQLEDYRQQCPDSKIPILLMGYYNPVMQYGFERFLERCHKVGVDGLIIPDLPVTIYKNSYKSLFEKHHISNVFLVTPFTSEKRIREIDSLTDSFIYAVSSASTTGSKSDFGSAQDYLKKLGSLSLDNAILTGCFLLNGFLRNIRRRSI